MQDVPKDLRVRAMLATLFGNDWENTEGDVAFEKAPVETWVFAIETMLSAADAADPIRVGIRGLMQEDAPADRSGSAMPNPSRG